jgi:phosphatidylinositol 3,4,5-trisphosphate-dependent Rac exchanger 2 protein
MIKPVQRVCKYPLLLKELLNRTEPSHSEHAVISEAFNKITDIVTSINEKKRDAEAVQKVLDLSDQISGATELPGGGLVSPTRKYVREGDIEYSVSGKTKDGHYFIFSDLFLITHRRGSSKFSLKHAFSFDSSVIRYVATYGMMSWKSY